jgi:uncharacterized protein (DUF952 family)/RimJ/RimL family protein N-acetyltransferase
MILLRPPRPEDAEALFPLVYQTPVSDTLVWDGPDSLESYRQRLAERAGQAARSEAHLFTVIEESSGRPVGSASLRPDAERFRGDIGLWIGIPYQGLGYGTLVVRKLLHYGFAELGMEKIEASVFVGNLASRRIFENNGFTLEGTIRKAVRKRGQALDEWLLGITRQDFEKITFSETLIVHLCPAKDWRAALKRGSYRPYSLHSEGFIHCSRPLQILAVANAYYAGEPGLVLLWIDPARIQPEIRWEAAPNGETYPHLYGPLNPDAVLAVTDFPCDKDGVFRSFMQPFY